MSTDTIVLTGTVVIEGVAFGWSVTDAQRITVSHPTIGEQTGTLSSHPEAQARTVGRAMLNSKAGVSSVGFLEAVDDVAMPHDGDPEPSTIL